jgi:hypothetical protein
VKKAFELILSQPGIKSIFVNASVIHFLSLIPADVKFLDFWWNVGRRHHLLILYIYCIFLVLPECVVTLLPSTYSSLKSLNHLVIYSLDTEGLLKQLKTSNSPYL